MLWKPSVLVVTFLLAIAIAVPVACAEDTIAFSPPGQESVMDRQGDYVITTGAPPPDAIVDRSGADGTLSFWELPPWIQIDYLSQIFLGFVIAMVSILKIGPFLLGKLKKLLDNQTRDQIYESVKQNPGSTMADITRRESLNIGTVRYHINQLHGSHKITFVRSEKFLRIFQNSHTYNDREKTIISALSRPAASTIVAYLDEHPGSINTQIAEHLKISESGTHVQLKKLLREEIVRAEQEGRTLRYFLKEDVKEYTAKKSAR